MGKRTPTVAMLIVAVMMLAVVGAISGCATDDDPATSNVANPVYVKCDSARIDANDLVGKSVADAEGIAESAGCVIRVVAGEGAPQIVSSDLVPNRINVHVSERQVSGLDPTAPVG
jgi:hypothetical protein